MKTADPLLAELKKIQEEEGLSLRDLADALGVHHMTVFRWFKEDRLSPMARKVIKQYMISRL